MKTTRDAAVGRVRHRVSLVLTLVDDFNNRVITGGPVRVWIPGEKPPIRKAEGYHVFTDLAGAEARLYVEAGLYESRSMPVRLDGEDGFPSLKVRMTPNRSYPIPRDTTCVEGRAEPESLIRILPLSADRPLRLVCDYQRGADGPAVGNEEISLYHPDAVDVEGRTLYIENGKSGGEFFRVLQRREAGGAYALERPLSRDYKKIGSAVYLVYNTRADEAGAFFLPIPRVTRDKNRFLCEAEGGRATVRLEREFKRGVVNALDFTAEGD